MGVLDGLGRRRGGRGGDEGSGTFLGMASFVCRTTSVAMLGRLLDTERFGCLKNLHKPLMAARSAFSGLYIVSTSLSV